jgi:hypothetical protein
MASIARGGIARGGGRVAAQTQAADDLRRTVARSLGDLAPDQRAAYLSAFIDGLGELTAAVSARKGMPGHQGTSTAPAVLIKSAGSGGRRRVASKKKRGRVKCPSCDKRMRAGDRVCQSCGNTNMRSAPVVKAARAMLGKAAGGRGGTSCWDDHWSPPGSRCCTTCGALTQGVSIPAPELIKSDPLAREHWRREWAGSPDPAIRELFQQHAYGTAGGSS